MVYQRLSYKRLAMVEKDFEREVVRKFYVGNEFPIQISLIKELAILPDQMITLVTRNSKRLDVACKNWGFYATPSINSRLADQNLRVAITENEQGRRYVLVVDVDEIMAFEEYCGIQKQRVVSWL
jgi:hypothetical protein